MCTFKNILSLLEEQFWFEMYYRIIIFDLVSKTNVKPPFFWK